MAESVEHVQIFAVQYIFQILAVLILLQYFINFQYIVFGDPAVEICDLLQASDLTVLVAFHGFYEVGSFHKAFMCTGIQPCESLAKKFYV